MGRPCSTHAENKRNAYKTLMGHLLMRSKRRGNDDINWLNSIETCHTWEADSYSASEEISCLLCNPKVHYRVKKNLSLVPNLRQIHSVQTFRPHFPKIHSNIILPSMSTSSEWFLSFRFPDQNFIYISHLSHAWYMPRSSRSSRSDDPNNIWWSVQVG